MLLQVNSAEPCRSTDDGYSTLSKLLPQFAKLGKFNIDKFNCDTPEPGKIKETFVINKAVYHKNCFSKFNQQKLTRALIVFESSRVPESNEEIVSPKRARRSDSTSKILLGELKCIFCLKIETSYCLCAAGTLHAKCDKVDDKHVHEFTEKIKNQDIKLGETQILARVSTGDVTTNEIFYHKTCLTNFNNQYRSALFKEHKLLYLDNNLNEEFRKAFAFNKIVSFIYEQRNIQADFLFEVISLENMYRELPQYDNIIYTSHVSRFTERLKSAIPELEKSS